MLGNDFSPQRMLHPLAKPPFHAFIPLPSIGGVHAGTYSFIILWFIRSGSLSG
jgi:hypothetical protein